MRGRLWVWWSRAHRQQVAARRKRSTCALLLMIRSSAKRQPRTVCGTRALEQLLAECDFISLHTAVSRNGDMINASLLRNEEGRAHHQCARGELINEADLAAAIKTATSRAALDFLRKSRRRIAADRASEVITPRTCGSTAEAQETGTRWVADPGYLRKE